MEGVGGASQDITWQRYNGVRRSNFVAEDERYAPEPVNEERGLDKGRRFVGQKDRRESMWTEITKDLVLREAIEGCGYDFEETEWFYYVMEYLRYVSMLSFPSSSSLSSLPPHFSFFFSPLGKGMELMRRTGRCPPPRRDLRIPPS